MIPIIVNNSRVPKILSLFSSVEIWAITIWPFIFCRGEMDALTLNHEKIHIEQYNETLIIGFLIIYAWDYLRGLIKYRGDLSSGGDLPFSSVGSKAYMRTRAEQEAYMHDSEPDYLASRSRYSWLKGFDV